MCCLMKLYRLKPKHQFLKTETSDKTIIGRNQPLKCLGLSLYPLLFYLNNPYNSEKKFNVQINILKSSKNDLISAISAPF